MKIGIIVFSKTGNTDLVAQRLREKLLTAGHDVQIEKITAYNDDQNDVSSIKLNRAPDINEYDALIFGSPVRGYSLSAVMTAYLSQLTEFKGKQVFCYVTEFFPFPSMGGNRAIEQMKKLCQSKGAKVCDTGIVNWSHIRRQKMINDMVEKMGKLF